MEENFVTGKLLKKIRIEYSIVVNKKVNQSEFASILGFTSSYISKLEQSRRVLSVSVLIKYVRLCKKYNIDSGELMKYYDLE